MVPDWRLVYPKTAQAVVDLLSDAPVLERTVVWLDDLHRLLAEPGGEQAAALLRELLEQPGPVAAVATMWPQNFQTLVATPYGGQRDHHAQARALLGCAWMVEVPETFTGQAWAEFQRRAATDAPLSAVAAAAEAEGVAAADSTVSAYLTYWLNGVAIHHLRENTHTRYAAAIRLHLNSGLGGKKLARLTTRDVRTFLDGLRTTCQCCAQERDTDRSTGAPPPSTVPSSTPAARA